jgi:hypothetical protein
LSVTAAKPNAAALVNDSDSLCMRRPSFVAGPALGPVHVWGLGVGIVLVGEFMGWNYGVGKGGAFGALTACFISGLWIAPATC